MAEGGSFSKLNYPDKFNDAKDAYAWMGVGIEFAIVVVFFTYLGRYLDRFQDTSPGFMIMGFLAGFAIVVVFFTYLGRYLDRFQDTSPGFMIMGFLAGFAIEMNIILRRAGVIKSKKGKEEEKKDGRKE